MKMLKFTVDGIEFRDLEDDSLESLRSEIGGGWLEEMTFSDGTNEMVAYFDEDGLAKNLPVNRTASVWISLYRGQIVTLVGTVLVFGLTDEGEITGLRSHRPVDIAINIYFGKETPDAQE